MEGQKVDGTRRHQLPEITCNDTMKTRSLAPDINNQKTRDNSGWMSLVGYFFEPTDEQLVGYYLCNKVVNGNDPVEGLVSEFDLNKWAPWDLPAEATMFSREKEGYFFSHPDRKDATGMPTNRATEAGFWKPTGEEQEVKSSRTGRSVGMKKTLVFYRGGPGKESKAVKTDWILHEYRIEGESTTELIHSSDLSKDKWVVCRLFQQRAGEKEIPAGDSWGRTITEIGAALDDLELEAGEGSSSRA